MGKTTRVAIVGGLLFAAVSAHAFTYFNLASADLGLTGQSNSQTLTVGGPAIGVQSSFANGQIDFFPGPPGLVAGDSSGVGFRTYSFTYQVGAPAAVNAVGIVVQGILKGTARIAIQEDIYQINANNSETLVASMSNELFVTGTTVNRGSLNLSAGGSFTYTDNTAVIPNLVNYKVKKSFFLQVTNWGTPNFNAANDIAAISLVQQNHQPVPEPATLATLGIGALAALRRRRAK